MNLNIDKIVSDKLAQMESERTIEKKIEETLEKTILSAVADALSDYKFKHEIQNQIAQNVNNLAQNCGLSGYNGFVAEKAAAVVRECYSNDFAEKVKSALDALMVKKYDNVKLSDIFSYYREWVCKNVDESEKYDRKTYTGSLDVEPASFGGEFIICRFADHPIEGRNRFSQKEDPEIEIKIYHSKTENSHCISSLYFDGHNMQNSLKIGFLSDFEQYVLNLFFNKTPIILDVNDVDDSENFDIDI